MERIAECVNILGEFCGKRDVPQLTQEGLEKYCHINQADVMVLFGGSILCGGDILAQAMRHGAAKRYVIVGGEGHTTEALRRMVNLHYPEIKTKGLPEAQVFDAYLKVKYGLCADLLECKSTNCGNNITCLLELLKENGIYFQSIILTQDATMQRRMEAGLLKYVSNKVKVINYASYQAEVIVQNSNLAYKAFIDGMWEVERYMTLLMGEIPRLTDDEQGYGPKGKGYIAHVEIPPKVQEAFDILKKDYGHLVRAANPLYGSHNQEFSGLGKGVGTS